jgi:hypothetical protein
MKHYRTLYVLRKCVLSVNCWIFGVSIMNSGKGIHASWQDPVGKFIISSSADHSFHITRGNNAVS